MNEKTVKRALLGVGVVLLALAGMGFFSLSGAGNACYYTQVDNTRFKQQEIDEGVISLTGKMPFSYTLPSYNDAGAEKEITFGTSRQLRDGAFLRLTTAPVRGVTDWVEVQYNELPPPVQKRYPANP